MSDTIEDALRMALKTYDCMTGMGKPGGGCWDGSAAADKIGSALREYFTLIAERDALKAEVKRAHMLQAQAESSEGRCAADNARLREALEKYGCHAAGCQIGGQVVMDGCTCGFSNDMRSVSG